MTLKHLPLSLAAVALAFVSCGPRWAESQEDGYKLITQRGGATLGYTSAPILQDRGYAFKDLNRNGALDPYEDWRLPARKRAEDLAARMSVEEISGLMLYSSHQAVPGSAYGFGGATYDGKPWAESGAEPWALTDQQKRFLTEDNLRAVLVTSVQSPEVAARWNNAVQALTEGIGLGIPANNSSDPRNETAATAEFNMGAGGQISLWPEPLGLAATFDPSLVRRFGEVASAEYRALGIATALSPQIDLATEPRWSRFSGTFGEDPALDTDMARAYVDGFQTTAGSRDGWGAQSVNAMVKHWPSGGPEEGGRDAHFNYGKYAVYPGGGFETHLRAFTEGAFKLNGGTGSASAVMPYYTISYGIDPSGANVGNSYSKYIIGELLRGKYGYDGVVCTDWNITYDNAAIESFDGKCWGRETLSVAERHYEVLKAGVDQFGGNNDKGPVLEAYRMWVRDFGANAADARWRESAVRLLLNSFRTGLFENPYTSPAEAMSVVGNPEFMAEGYAAQLKSVVLLKNHGGVLPQIPGQAGDDGGAADDGTANDGGETADDGGGAADDGVTDDGGVTADGFRHSETAANTRHTEAADDTRHTEAAADTRHTEAANDTRHPETAAATRHTRHDRVSVFVPQRWVPQTPGMFGLSMGAPGHWEYPVDRALVEKYYDWAETPDEADFALVVIQEPLPGSGYDVQDRARGGNGYVPISLQYRPYTAEYARTESVAGGDPKETFVNRSYKGKTVSVYNESDLDLVLKTRAEMGAKPVVVVVNVSRPVVLAEIEPLADAVLLSFKVQHQAVLDIVSGAAEPSGLLPMQLPADMRTVEEQCEDLPHDMRPLVDADGGVWDFAYGLNWAGEISDSRTEKYRIK